MAPAIPNRFLPCPRHRLADVVNVGNGHVRLRAEAGDGSKIDGIAFRAAAEPWAKRFTQHEAPPFISREPWRRIASAAGTGYN